MRILFSALIGFCVFGTGCSLIPVVEKDHRASSDEKPLVDLFAADKMQLIEEIRRLHQDKKILEEDKATLIQNNIKVSADLREMRISRQKALREKQEAVAKAKMALSIPERPDGRYTEHDYHNMGVKAFTQGEYQSALANFRKSIALNGKFFEAYTNIGVVYMTLGDLDQARLHFKKALEIQPDFQYAKIYLEQTEERLKKAEASSLQSVPEN